MQDLVIGVHSNTLTDLSPQVQGKTNLNCIWKGEADKCSNIEVFGDSLRKTYIKCGRGEVWVFAGMQKIRGKIKLSQFSFLFLSSSNCIFGFQLMR